MSSSPLLHSSLRALGSTARHQSQRAHLLMCLLLSICLAHSSAHAQLSLSNAVDQALGSNPRVKMAQSDLARARAQLQETHDVYVPSLTAGAGLGEAYGYSPNPPTLFTFNGGSLVYSAAQIYYIRSARAGVIAARYALQEASDGVAEDTVQAYLALHHDQQRLAVLTQQSGDAASLVTIVQERLDAGQAAPIDLTQAKLTGANLRLSLIHGQDDVAADRDHLARLVGVSPATLAIADVFPATPDASSNAPLEGEMVSPAISSAYANALARQQQAIGDARFRFRPQINLFAQYNRYATFTQTFKSLDNLYNQKLTANEYAIGVQITVPLYDRGRGSKASETTADAAHALHDAENAKLNTLDAQARIRHALPEIQARAEVAALQQQLAQQQLEILRVQLQSGNPNGPQMTPADEQNALIAERDKYLNVLDADFQLRTTEIQLLRLSGRLAAWLRSQPAPSTATSTGTAPGAIP